MPILSVVLPIYNMGEWLAPAIESCLWQTHKDIEVLIIDDGSSDAGPDMAAAYARQDSRIRLISQRNSGAGAARQRGQDEASGDYITWLDADDFLDETAAAAWLAAIEEDVDLICGNAFAFSARTFNVRKYFPHPPARRLRFDEAPRYWKSKVLWRWAFSLPFLRREGVRHLQFKLGQDVCFMFECLLRARSFSQVASPVYYFRQEHKSAYSSTQTFVEHGLAHFIEVRRILLSPPDGRPRIKPLVKYLNENYWRDIRKLVLRPAEELAHWEAKAIELGLELFDGMDAAWFRTSALAPEVREQTNFLPLAEAFIRKDVEAVRRIMRSLRLGGVSAPEKRKLFHTARHTVKSLLNPSSWKVRNRLRRLEALAARRTGIPRAIVGSGHHSGR